MDSEVKSWLTFAAIALVVVFGVPASCIAHHNHKAAELLDKGVSGVDVRCAMGTGDSNSEACILAAEKKRAD